MILRASVALDAEAIARCVKRIGREIVEHHGGVESVALIGILRRGANLAERIAARLNENGNSQVPVGTLDISSYRDDGKGAAGDPRLLGRHIPFSLEDRHVVLVDDVLYTGRTVRAALTALADLGRPKSIELAALIDRGERELPIRADYIGKNIAAPEGQRVYVKLIEVDGIDAVLIGEQKSDPSLAKDRTKAS
jgi:pyrimidine operon attenuation protein/uracil phosphoribosyltransferase